MYYYFKNFTKISLLTKILLVSATLVATNISYLNSSIIATNKTATNNKSKNAATSKSVATNKSVATSKSKTAATNKSKNILAIYKINNTWYAINEDAKLLYSTNKILEVEKYGEELLGTYFNDDGFINCGYFDNTGKIVLTSPTHVPYAFQSGLALIIQILDSTGREAKFGFIDKKGKIVLPIKYLDVRPFTDNNLAYAMNFDERGFINTNGKFVIKMEKGFAGYGFSEGYSAVSSIEKTRFGFIDTTGKLVLDYQFEEVGKFSEGLCKVYRDSYFGYINKKGIFVINARFSEATDFKCGRAFVSNFNFEKDKHEWAVLDADGVLVTLFEFDYYKSFSEDLAAVKVGDNWKYINKAGRPAFAEAEYKYSEDSYEEEYFKFTGSFKNNKAIVVDFNDNKYVINNRGEKLFSIPAEATVILDCRTNERYEAKAK